jgi:dienelactone hydrolase
MPLKQHPTVTEPDPGLEIIVHSAEVGPAVRDYHPLRILTSRGTVEGRYYSLTRPAHGVVISGGCLRTWDSPAVDLYPRLCQALRLRSVAALRTCFRRTDVPEECVLDTLAGVAYLESEGVRSIALVGHGVGAAAVLHAAAATSSARAVVALSPQGNPDGFPTPGCPLLLVQPEARATCPWGALDAWYRAAAEPKRLVRWGGAGRVLGDAGRELHSVLFDWILVQLKGHRGNASANDVTGRSHDPGIPRPQAGRRKR